MTPEARAMTQILLDHHRDLTLQFPPGASLAIDRYLIAYGVLCERMNAAYLTRNAGRYLEETARWCADNGWPPLNSLAVNAETRMPGDGYDGAGGFRIVNWPEEVALCIRCDGYPATAPQH